MVILYLLTCVLVANINFFLHLLRKFISRRRTGCRCNSGFGPPRTKSASGSGPPGPNLLADLVPHNCILADLVPPSKMSVLSKYFL